MAFGATAGVTITITPIQPIPDGALEFEGRGTALHKIVAEILAWFHLLPRAWFDDGSDQFGSAAFIVVAVGCGETLARVLCAAFLQPGV